MHKIETLNEHGYRLFIISNIKKTNNRCSVILNNGDVDCNITMSEPVYTDSCLKTSIFKCKAGDKIYVRLFNSKTNSIQCETINRIKWKTIQQNWEKEKKHFLKLYHLSPVSKRKSILQSGLKPTSFIGGNITYSNRIFLTTHMRKIYEILDMIGYGEMDIWEINNERLSLELNLDEFAKMERCVYVTQEIASKHLKLIKTII